MKSMAAGAAGGLAAAAIMGLFENAFAKAQRAYKGPSAEESAHKGEDATVKTANAISKSLLHHELTEPEKKWAGPLVHYTFGTLIGAIYGAMSAAAPVVKTGAGTAYGAAVWLGADEIAIPALGLSGPRQKSPAASRAKFLAAHLIYGATTHFLGKVFLKPLES